VRTGASETFRTHDVVPFVSLPLDARDPVGLEDLLDPGDLQDQVLRRRRPVGLVVRVEVVPEGGRGKVEDHGQVLRLVVLDDLLKGLDKSVEGVAGKPVGGGQPPYGMVRPIQGMRAVDQKEPLEFSHRILSQVKGQRSKAKGQRETAIPGVLSPLIFHLLFTTFDLGE